MSLLSRIFVALFGKKEITVAPVAVSKDVAIAPVVPSKTKYRIITNSGYRLLQFEFNGKWVHVPDPTSARVIGGDLLIKEKCPEKTSLATNYYWLSDSFCNDRKLIAFAKKYPFIDDYFAELPAEREEYLKREEEKQNRPTTYL